MAKQVAVVSGAGGGIGSAVVIKLLAEGWQVIGLDRSEQSLEHLAEHDGHGLQSEVGDITDDQWVTETVGRVQAEHGQIDALINAAGIFLSQPIEELALDKLHLAWSVNVFAKLVLMRAVIPFMKQAGRGYIVNVASVAGLRPFPEESAYNATMYAVVGLTEAAHEELKPCDIHVSAVAPGLVDTPLARQGFQLTPAQWADVLQPSDVANEIYHQLQAGPNEFHRVVTLEPKLVF